MNRLKTWIVPAMGVGAILTTLLTWQQPASAATPGFDGALTVTTANQVINQFADLTAIDSAAKSITVDSIANLTSGAPVNGGALVTGDLLMLYQAQGATIDVTDTASYGNVSAYNTSGKYQFVTVGSITGNTITLASECGALTAFDPNYAQVVRVPQLSSLSVSGFGSITAPVWNGTTGGIVVADVSGATTLSSAGAINVNAKGFRGAAPDTNSSTSPYDGTLQSGYRYATDATSTTKGEGIAGPAVSLSNGPYGRGAPANGGGGGNGHNGGGGGGSNGGALTGWNGTGSKSVATANWADAWNLEAAGFATNVSPGGGRGGYTYFASDQDALTLAPSAAAWGGDQRDNVGGFGGRPLDTSGNRAFLGGGGGAGEWNGGNAAATVGGGNGGGLVYLTTGSLAGTGSILANGGGGGDSGATDSASGGGGGGAILIESPAMAPAGLTLNANGGAGGSQTANNGAEGEGPGGGGGGGYIAVGGGTKTADGGANGTSVSALITEFLPNGATMGTAGTTTATPPTAGSLSCYTPRIGIAKEIGTPTVSSADKSTYDIPYTIRLSSYGENLTGVTVTDDLATTFPGATLSITAGPTLSAISAGSALTLSSGATLLSSGNLVTAGNFNRLADGTDATATITFTVRVRPVSGTTSSTVFSNSATASGTFTPASGAPVVVTDTSDSGTNPDTNGNRNGNETGENDPTTNSLSMADLSLSKTGPASVVSGGNIVFTLTLSNAAGSSTATGVQVKDQLPSGYTYVADNGAGAYISGTGIWTVANIAAGASAQLQITASVNPTGIYANTAQVSASNLPDPDSLPNNSSASEDDQASLTPTVTDAAGANFPCDGTFYQVRSSGTNTALLKFSGLAGGSTASSVWSAVGTPGLNGMAFNRSDGFLYALRTGVTASSREIYKLGNVGSSLVGTVVYATGGAYDLTNAFVITGGTFDSAGRFFFVGQGGGNVVPNAIYRVDSFADSDLGTAGVQIAVAQVYTFTGTVENVGDFAFGPDGNLYGATNTNLYQFALGASTATVTQKTIPTVTGIGSAYFDNNYTFYVYANGTQTLYEVNFSFGAGFATDPATSSSAGSIPYSGPLIMPSGSSDGASCALPSNNIAGTVWNDRNGNVLIDGAPLEPGTNAGGLYVYAVNSSGNVVAKTGVATTGAYTLYGLRAGSYTLRLSTNATPAIGDAAPVASSLPTGWVNTGERNSTGTETTTPGDIAVTVAASDLNNLNFAIEQTPTANAVSASSQINPGGTTRVTVPNLGGSDPEDGTLGTGGTIIISSLATNGTLYYSGIAVTLGQVIGSYDPSLLKVDPDNGAVSVSFTYQVRDAAGRDSAAATVTMPFSSTPPVANAITNATIPSNAADTSISSLTGSDADGTVVSFRVTTLPPVTQGLLRWDDDNNATTPPVNITTTTDIPLAAANRLLFDPSGTYTGNVNFPYTATDNSGLTSSAATYTIPVGNTPPVANPITNASIPSTAGDTGISSLTGSDLDGTVVSFTVTALPLASQGVLRWDDDNNVSTPPVAVSTSTVIPLASANKLLFDPSSSFTGNVSFTYTATDNLSAVSSAATYTIPVGNNPPTASNSTNASMPNSSGPTSIGALQAADTDGSIVSYTITVLPPASQGALTKADGTPIAQGDSLTPPEAANLKFVPNPGFAGNYVFKFTATDNSSAVSNEASFTVPVTAAATVSGTVWDDKNGDGNIAATGEPGTDASGLYAVLTNSSNQVLQVVAVANNGTYSFAGIAPNTDYKLLLSTTNPAINSTLNTSSIPSAWTNTTPDVLTFNSGSSSVTNRDFGLDQLPDTDDKTVGAQPNPAGSTLFTVPTLSGNDPEDGVISSGNAFQATQLPNNGTLYYNGTLVTLNQIITAYDPSKLRLDPNDGVTSVSFKLAAVDAANKPDPSPATVTMDFIPVLPPVAIDNTATTTPNVAVTIDVPGNDTASTPLIITASSIDLDPSVAGQQTTKTVTGQGSFDLIASGPDAGKVKFTPASGFTTGLVSIQYTIQDSLGQTSNVANISVEVNVPAANPDTVNTPFNTAININAAANDTTIVGRTINPSSIDLNPGLAGQQTSIALPEGTFALITSGVDAGKVKFTPTPGFVGMVATPYTISDGVGTSNDTTITVTVDPPAAPVATADSTSTPLNTAVNLDAKANDTSSAGTTLDASKIDLNPSTIALDSSITTSQGTFTLIISGPDAGKIRFNPATDFVGTATTPYTIQDSLGQTSNQANLSVIVNAPPAPVANPDNTSTAFNTAVNLDAKLNDSTSAGTTLDASKIDLNPSTPAQDTSITTAQGTFALITTGPDAGKVKFTPVPGFVGTATAPYTIKDNLAQTSNSALLTVVVNAPAAPNAANDAAGTPFNTPVTIDVKLNDTSSAGTTLDASKIDLNPSTPGQDSSVTTPEGTFELIVTGPDAGKVKFTPVPGFTGTASVPYTIKDNLGQTSNTATITVTVSNPGAPVANDDATTTAFNTAVNLDPKSNDTSSAGTTLDASKIDLNPATPAQDASITTAQGTFDLITTGPDAGKVKFTPAPGFVGTATAPYTIKDNLNQTSNSALLRVVVNTPPAPVATADSTSTPFNTSVNLDPKTNDTSSTGTTLNPLQIDLNPSTPAMDSSISTPNGTFTLISVGPDAGKVTFAPNAGFVGTATTPYTIKDSLGQTSNSADLSVTVNPPATPSAVNDATGTPFNTPVTVDAKLNDTSSAGTTLDPSKIDLNPSTPGQDSSVTSPEGTFELIATGPDVGKVKFTPNAGFTGSASVPYTIKDNLGQTSNAANITVTVAAPNAPTAQLDTANTPLNTPVTIDAKANDSAAGGATLDPSKIDLNPSTPGQDSSVTTAQGTFELIATGPDAGKVKFTPATGFTGTASVPYTIKDNLGTTSNTATITVTVAPPNAPVATNDAASTPFNTPLNVPAASNDSAASGATIDPSSIDLNPATPGQDSSVSTLQGTFTLISTGPDAGQVRFSPVAGFTGVASLPYSIKDNFAATSNTATISVTVNPPAAPIANDDTASTPLNTAVNLDPKSNDSSSAGTTLDASKIDLNPATVAQDSSITTAQGTFDLITTGADAGKVRFTPNTGFTGTALTPYTIKDNLGQTSNQANLRVTVIGTPSVTKTFASSTVAADGTVAMSITITNPNGSLMNGVAFSDSFPAGLEIASTPSATQCAGTVSSTTNSLSLSGGTIAANSSCIVTATVRATRIGAITNVLPVGAVTTTNAGSSPTPASATLETASVGAAKSASVINNGDGTYNITYLIALKNLGSVPLTNVQAIENLENTFTGTATWSIVGTPSISGGTGLTLNPSFNGRVAGSTSLLNAGSGLAIGATSTVTVTVRVNPNGNPSTTAYNNQVKATASGNGPGGATPAVTDLSSNSGTNPDPNGDGNPNEPGENDPTGVSFSENPVIGAAKSAGALTSNGNGTYTQAFTVTVRNYGDVPLSNLNVTENLSSVFGTALVSTGNLTVTGAAGVSANTGFNGIAQTNLAATGSTLAVGARATFSFDVVIRPSATASSFTNSVTARASSPSGSPIADDSVNGLDPNPTPGTPSDDTGGTPIVFAKITGHVFSDINGDGTQQAGEPNLNGNTVTITPVAGPSFTVLTDSNGDYTAIVPAGNSKLEATAPAGNLVTTGNNPQNVNAVVGTSTASAAVGFQPKGTVKGHVWTDRDFSGVQEAGEPNLVLTDVTILDSSGTIQTVQTDSNGDFTANVPFGPVTVTASKPAGSRLSSGNNPQTITITDSSVRTLTPIGFHPDGLVSGVIFEDTNGNGLQDPGENGLLGIPVKITDVQGTITTVLTDSSGAYSLNVPAGSTTVAVTTPGGTLLTTANATQTILAIGKTNTPAAKIGFQPQNKVVGHVFNDPNGNGIQDAGETNIANQNVSVTDSSGAVQTVKTNATGDYVAFVIPGKTTINVVDPTGSSLTTANDPQDVTVLAGQTATATPVGFQARGTLSGHLFNDVDGDGLQDPGEPNLPGLTVTITDANGKTITLISDANGDYTTSVPVGSTIVSVAGPNGAIATTANNPQTVTVPVGGNANPTPIGFQVQSGSLTGRVFNDTNGNGVQDSGEPGIEGVRVTVIAINNGIHFEITDSNGDYKVPSLLTGNARITVTDPGGLALTTNNNPQDVIITSGSNTVAANVGYVKPSLQLSKRALSPQVAIGEILEYELVVTNSSPIDVRDVVIIDELPLGLAYKAGSSTVAGLKLEPKLASKNGRQILTWTVPGILTPSASGTIKFATVVTPSATQKLENVATASAIAGTSGASTLKVAAQSAVATTKIVQAVFNNKSMVVGRVYFDRDRDANFTSVTDVPLAGARVYLSDGRYAITDAQGRYSVPDIAPGVYVVRLDRLTAPYAPVRVPTDVGLPGTRRVDAQGGLYEANFPLLEPDASVAKERETMVERGSVKLEKTLERIPASTNPSTNSSTNPSDTEKPGYVIRETVTVSKTIANLTITDPLPPGATRGPILLVGSDGKEITVTLLEDGRIQIPGKLEAGTYTLVYTISTTLTPDQVVTDPSINYDEVIR